MHSLTVSDDVRKGALLDWRLRRVAGTIELAHGRSAPWLSA